MTCNERFDLSGFFLRLPAAYAYMTGGLNTRTIHWVGLHGIWSKERKSWHGDLGDFNFALTPFKGRGGNIFRLYFFPFLYHDGVFLLVNEKEAL